MSIYSIQSSTTIFQSTYYNQKTIKNKDGWKLTLSKVNETCQINLTDKWGINVTQAVTFVGPQPIQNKPSSSLDLINKEFTKLERSERQRFGFQVNEQDGKYFVVFGDYGLKGGTKEGALDLGVGAAAIGGGLLIFTSAPVLLGGVFVGGGISLAQYAWTTPENEFTNKKAAKAGLIGGACAFVGGGISTLMGPAAAGAPLADKIWNAGCRTIASSVSSTTTQTVCNEGRAPKTKELVIAVGAGLVGAGVSGGTSSALSHATDDLVDKATIGMIAGGASSATSNTISNGLNNKSLEDGLGFAVISGAYSNSVHAVREEMDRKAKLEENTPSNPETPNSDEHNELINTIRLQDEAFQKRLNRIDAKYGPKVDELLADKFFLTDQRMKSRKVIIENLAQDHSLCFHHPDKKPVILKNDIDAGWNSPYMIKKRQSHQENLKLLAAYESQKTPPKDDLPSNVAQNDLLFDNSLEERKNQLARCGSQLQKQWEDILSTVTTKYGDQVNDLQRQGFKLKDLNLNGNISAILEEMAKGASHTYKKSGCKSKNLHSPTAKEAYESLIHAQTLLETNQQQLSVDQGSSLKERNHNLLSLKKSLSRAESILSSEIERQCELAFCLQSTGASLKDGRISGNPEAIKQQIAMGEMLAFKKPGGKAHVVGVNNHGVLTQEIQNFKRQVDAAAAAIAADF